MKYYSQSPDGPETSFHKVIAKIGGSDLEVNVATTEEQQTVFNTWSSSCLQVAEGQELHEELAIGRYLAKTGSKKERLIGSTIFNQSKIDQWTSWTNIHVRNQSRAVNDHVNGKSTDSTLDFQVATQSLKNTLKFVNTQLGESKHLVGSELTIADVYLASYLVTAFTSVLDKGVRKSISNVVNWFTETTNSDEFKAIIGEIKLCSKPFQPKSASDDKSVKQEKKQNDKQQKENKGDKKGAKVGKKKGKEDKPAAGVPDDVEFADPIYEKYKTIFKNAVYGKVITRFPPEPSGFLHIGHIKASMLNYHYSKIYNGQMICRFDDTNPSKEKEEFVQNITKDLKTCEVYPTKVTFTSDYFDIIQEKMREFIRMGMAYADDTPGEEMKAQRDIGEESKNKSKTPKESEDIFNEMLLGNAKGWCIRANLDMSNPVKCLRDPVMYRLNDTPHHRTGTKYKAYPTYDFACPIVDAEEKVSNCLRTIEYKDRDALYHLIQEKLGYTPIEIFEYSKLQLKSTLMSKRKLQWFVDEGLVEGWNDPRFPTVQGLMRRGLTIQTLKEFMLEQGPSLNTVRMEWDKLWATNKKIIDPICKRFYAILDDSAAEVLIENGPEVAEGITIDYHPKDPTLGCKVRTLTNHLYIEKEDLEGLKIGDKFTLSRWGNVYIKSIEENEGKTKVVVELNLKDVDFKGTTKATFVPVDDKLNIKVTICEFGHLITIENLKEDQNIEDFVNHNSLVKSVGYAEKDLERCKKGDFIQIERRGYFYVDKDLKNDGEIVLNFIPDGKTKNMSKIASKIASNTLTKGEGAGDKAANKAEQVKKDGTPADDKPLSKSQLKKLANKEKKKAKKQELKAEAPTEN